MPASSRRPRIAPPQRGAATRAAKSPRESRRLTALLCCCALFGGALPPLTACAGPPPGTIGAVLGRQGSGRVFLREVPPHLAAGRAGLRAGDEILFVDGRDVRLLTEAELRRALGGQVGETVQLTLARGEEILRVTLTRSQAEPYRVR